MSILDRRRFLCGAAVSTVAANGAAMAATDNTETDTFQFEVQRSETEWRARLSPEEYRILREGGTEKKFTSPYVTETRDGIYRCKGCDLELYSSLWKVQLDIGWVFFRHAEPRSVLLGMDGDPFIGDLDVRDTVAIETHCRRCGSHLGHIVHAQGQLVHCINGASLTFAADAA